MEFEASGHDFWIELKLPRNTASDLTIFGIVAENGVGKSRIVGGSDGQNLKEEVLEGSRNRRNFRISKISDPRRISSISKFRDSRISDSRNIRESRLCFGSRNFGKISEFRNLEFRISN